MTTAVYLRQSLDREGNMLAVNRQRDPVLELCAQRGWHTKEYVDDDFSASGRMPGSKKRAKPRPAFDRMIADIKAGRIHAIAAWDADRLYRHPRELEDLIDLADERGLQLATVGGDFDLSTPTGRGNARMKGVFARMEMEQKSVRHKLAQKQMAETEGRPWWPARPFGYIGDPDPLTGEQKWWTVKRDAAKRIIAVNTIRKHPTEAKLVAQAYRDFNRKSSVRSIAAKWNAKGITTPRGNRWTGTGVRQLLANPRNAGLREYDGKLLMAKDENGVSTGEPLRGTWPPLVSEAIWRAAWGRLSNPARTMAAPRGRKYLLSGLALCGRCGHTLGSAISSRGQRQYACNHCQRLSRDGVKLDAFITEAVIRRLAAPDASELLRPPVAEVDATTLRERRRVLEGALTQLGEQFAASPETFRSAALVSIQSELDAINTQLEDPGKAAVFEGVIGKKDVTKAWARLDLDRQRTILDTLMTITVNPVGKGTGMVWNPSAIGVAWKS